MFRFSTARSLWVVRFRNCEFALNRNCPNLVKRSGQFLFGWKPLQ